MLKMTKTTMSIIALFAVLATSSAFAAPGAEPESIHLSWQNSPATTMTIMWWTNSGIAESLVEYGLDAGYGSQIAGTVEPLPEGRGNNHTVEITGLNPKTQYHYRVGGGGIWSGDKTFETVALPEDVCEPYRFVVLGDSRSSITVGASLYWSTVLDAATDEDPLFIIFNGDAINDGDEQEEGWEDWFEKAHGDISTQPMMMVWGNHEHHGTSYFLNNFAMPVNDVTATEDFYDFQVGPIHFFSLDTEVQPYATQATWLDNKLTGTSAIWTMALNHRSTYSSGTTHGSADDNIDFWGPVFDAHHLDINIGSHDHIYERTKPIYGGTPIPNEDYSQGTMYLVSGGAGAFCNPILNIFNDFYLVGIGATHYILFEVEYNKLIMTVKSDLGIVYDSYTLEKPEIGFPTAEFVVVDPDNIYALEPAAFDAAASSDPCGEIIDYAWNFGDGQTGNGRDLTHVFSEEGSYTVRMVVTDIDGYGDETTALVNVLPAQVDDDVNDDADDDVDDDVNDDINDDVNDDADDDWVNDDTASDDDAVNDDASDDDTAEEAGDDDDDESGGCGC